MSNHNICFRGEIRKILCGYPLLSVAMHDAILSEMLCLSTFCVYLELCLSLRHMTTRYHS